MTALHGKALADQIMENLRIKHSIPVIKKPIVIDDNCPFTDSGDPSGSWWQWAAIRDEKQLSLLMGASNYKDWLIDNDIPRHFITRDFRAVSMAICKKIQSVLTSPEPDGSLLIGYYVEVDTPSDIVAL